MMMKGFGIEENMLNLTSASGGVRTSSGSRVKTGTLYTQNSFNSSINEAPPSKKKRSLPGNLDAEVIALSPKSLKDTNRFICEICNKGFRRDQNLQLHRRGHNLPWKLKQSEKKVERKKVYVCPEPTCGHHDPSRALGDLTGIKKHFSRKHGEKNWKCEKCSKKYAVQSDWKAHSKICGTREYKCDCGKIFSRRDSFITHRAFCDVLAEESARAITSNPFFSSQQQPNSLAAHMFNFPPHQLQSQGLQALQVKGELEDQCNIFNNPTRPHDSNNIPPWLACSSVDLSSQLFSGNSFSKSLVLNGNPSPNPNATSFAQFEPPTTSSPHTSATALLQKAAQMGATMSTIPSALPSSMLRVVPHQNHHMSEKVTVSTSTAGAGASGLGLSSREELASGSFVHNLASFGNNAAAATSAYMEQFAVSITAGAEAVAAAPSLLHDMMMSSLSSANGFDEVPSSFDETLNGILNPKGYSNVKETQLPRGNVENRGEGGGSNVGGSDGLTRDFFGTENISSWRFYQYSRIS